MPVVAIPLNDQSVRWHERVNAELPADDVLPLVQHADVVKDRVSSYFDFVRIGRLLHGVHGDQHCPSCRVSIPALQGAVRDVPGLPRRRPPEHFAAHLAGVTVLVSALPFVRMVVRAEVVLRAEAILGDIHRVSTESAGKYPSRFTTRLRPGAVAIKRAVFLACSHMPRDNLVAIRAGDGSHLVSKCSLHAVNYTRNAATSNPMEFM